MEEYTQLISPFTCLVAGPTMCGKSQLVAKLIEHVHPKPTRIIWVYDEWHPTLLLPTEYYKGWSQDIYDSISKNDNNLLILDDVMSTLKHDETIGKLFTVGAHHKNISVIAIVQNLFFQGKAAVDIRRNSTYIILFKCKQDKNQISAFGKRLGLGHFVRAYDVATTQPHGYLLIDLRNDCPTEHMLRSNIEKSYTQVYLE